MLIISELNYLLSQKVNVEVFSADERAVIYYDDTDMIPAKAFIWMSKMSDRIKLMPYSNIGGRDNLSFAVGGYVIGSKSKTAVIVGALETEVRVLNINDKEYKIYTTSEFSKVESLGRDEAATSMETSDLRPDGIIDKIIRTIPSQMVPAGTDIESFARILDTAISRSKGDRNEVMKYLESNLGKSMTDVVRSLSTAGVFEKISEIVLKG